jgi:hypothetical protein
MVASHSGRFTPGERDPDTNYIGGKLGPRAGLEESLALAGKKNATVLLLASRFTNRDIPAARENVSNIADIFVVPVGICVFFTVLNIDLKNNFLSKRSICLKVRLSL